MKYILIYFLRFITATILSVLAFGLFFILRGGYRFLYMVWLFKTKEGSFYSDVDNVFYNVMVNFVSIIIDGKLVYSSEKSNEEIIKLIPEFIKTEDYEKDEIVIYKGEYCLIISESLFGVSWEKIAIGRLMIKSTSMYVKNGRVFLIKI